MAVALGKGRNEALVASGPALRGLQATVHSALPLFDRQPACLQSGALIARLPVSLSTLPLFRGALELDGRHINSIGLRFQAADNLQWFAVSSALLGQEINQ